MVSRSRILTPLGFRLEVADHRLQEGLSCDLDSCPLFDSLCLSTIDQIDPWLWREHNVAEHKGSGSFASYFAWTVRLCAILFLGTTMSAHQTPKKMTSGPVFIRVSTITFNASIQTPFPIAKGMLLKETRFGTYKQGTFQNCQFYYDLAWQCMLLQTSGKRRKLLTL